MRFEIKSALVFTLIVTVGFTVIDTISFLYYKKTLENSLYKEADLYLKLFIYDKTIKLPDYLIIKTDGEPVEPNFVPVTRSFNQVVFIKEDYLKNRLFTFYTNTFLWNAVTILLLYIFFHYTVLRYIKKESDIRKTLEISLLSVSHKLGNFLSISKMNIEMLKEKCKTKEVERLEKSYMLMEKDFKNITTLLKNTDKKERVINIKTIIKKLLEEYQSIIGNKKLIFHSIDFYVRADEEKVKISLQNVLENASKYSKTMIHIKMCSTKKQLLIAIRNDIHESSNFESTGVGLKVSESLLKSIGGNLKYRGKNNHYITVITIKKV